MPSQLGGNASVSHQSSDSSRASSHADFCFLDGSDTNYSKRWHQVLQSSLQPRCASARSGVTERYRYQTDGRLQTQDNENQWCAGQSLEAVEAVPQQGAKAKEGHQERAVFLDEPSFLCLAQQDLQDAPG